MLVLTIDEREQAIVETPSGPVVVKVLRRRGKRFSVGIEAPKQFPIRRRGKKGPKHGRRRQQTAPEQHAT